MAYDLTLTSPTYSASGKFGSCLNGGFGRVSGVLPAGSVWTFETWAKTSSTTAANRLILGIAGTLYAGLGPDHKPLLAAGAGNAPVGTQPTLNDDQWHHYRIVGTNTGVLMFVDGTLVLY